MDSLLVSLFTRCSTNKLDDFGDGCDYFEISCTGGEGFKIRMELSKRIICANYGFDNALKEPPTVRIME